MTAAASPKSPVNNNKLNGSPTGRSNAKSNSSAQMSGVFGKCTEPVPTNVASIRQQQLSAQRNRSSVSMESPGGSASPAVEAEAFRKGGKTVGTSSAQPMLKKKAGSVPMAEVNIYTPPEPIKPRKVRPTQQHTDPFSEDRVRDQGKLRKVLVPESSTKAPKAISLRVSENTKAKWESPYATDDVSNCLQTATSGTSSPSCSSPTRGSYDHSPIRGKRVPTKTDSDIFAEPSTEGSVPRGPSTNSRYQHSSQGLTTMHNERPEAEISKERANHKRVVNPPTQTMEGVFTIVEKKNRHPNYRFSAPFARQGSIAASARIGGKRHKVQPVAIQQGEVVTPFANDITSDSPAPAEFNGNRPKKVFAEKHTVRTPFARHGSLPPSQRANYARRTYHTSQKAASPFAVDE